MTNDRRRTKIDKTKLPDGSNIPKGSYSFVFSSNIEDWQGGTRMRKRNQYYKKYITQ